MEVPLSRKVRGAVGGLRTRLLKVGSAAGEAPAAQDPGWVRWREVDDWMPDRAAAENFRGLADRLDAAGVDWWLVRGLKDGVYCIGVDQADRAGALAAIAALPAGQGWLVAAGGARPVAASQVESLAGDVLHVGVPTRCRGVEYGLEYGCELEFWKRRESGYLGPRENQASRDLSLADMQLTETVAAGRAVRTPQVFTRRMVDDITFPIDIVYTWVDGSDPVWQAERDRAAAELVGEPMHSDATDAARFRSRDELRYSLRSLAMFAPWVRRVFLVTAGHVPAWLNLDNPRLEHVEHARIFQDPAELPTFNSRAINSYLHHIPGLAEHCIYMNDDVFFARPARPSHFFTPSGQAKVFPSPVRRGFGEASEAQPPHVNGSRNVRRLLEAETGVTISRVPRHTPHPQLTSVHFQLEERFSQEYRVTRSNRFRHHTDVPADLLFHHYAQITGVGVADFDYAEAYFSLRAKAARSRMEKFIQTRDRATFCLNDTPTTGEGPVSDEFLHDWLEQYFPIPSEFERPGA